jgi:hypothetical protein
VLLLGVCDYTIIIIIINHTTNPNQLVGPNWGYLNRHPLTWRKNPPAPAPSK